MLVNRALAVNGVSLIESFWKIENIDSFVTSPEDKAFFHQIKWLNGKERTIERAIEELTWFRLFIPTQHPHSPNGELLQICLPLKSENDLNIILKQLEITLENLLKYPDSYYQKFTDKYYKEGVYTSEPRPKEPILGHGLGQFKGNQVVLEITQDRLFVSIIMLPNGGRSWTIEDYHIDIAKDIEILLNKSKFSCIDPPLNLKNYICPKNFPFLFNVKFTANKKLNKDKNSWLLLLRRLF